MTALAVGGILAVLGPGDKAMREDALAGMAARAPHRGALTLVADEDSGVGVECLSWDASLASSGDWVAACHGYIGNWDELESRGLTEPTPRSYLRPTAKWAIDCCRVCAVSSACF